MQLKTQILFKMRISIILLLFFSVSCGSGLDGEEETYTYTFILKNGTGTKVTITGDSPQRIQDLQNGETFICKYNSTPTTALGMCESYVFIHFPEINKGYRCYKGSNNEGFCFEGGQGLFTKLTGTIFTKTGIRSYEYILTPELLENAFELPE